MSQSSKTPCALGRNKYVCTLRTTWLKIVVFSNIAVFLKGERTSKKKIELFASNLCI